MHSCFQTQSIKLANVSIMQMSFIRLKSQSYKARISSLFENVFLIKISKLFIYIIWYFKLSERGAEKNANVRAKLEINVAYILHESTLNVLV